MMIFDVNGQRIVFDGSDGIDNDVDTAADGNNNCDCSRRKFMMIKVMVF